MLFIYGGSMHIIGFNYNYLHTQLPDLNIIVI